MRRPSRPGMESLETKALLSDLSVSIATDKPSYAPGEPVQMTLTETNVTNHDVSVTWGPSNSGFDVAHDGTTVWASNEEMNPMFISLQTLKPGESFTRQATWNGAQDEGAAVGPTGSFVATNQMAPSTASAVFTIDAAGSTSRGSTLLPLTSGTIGTSADLASEEVKAVYRTVLGRAADPKGLAEDVQALQGGTSLKAVASGVLHSTEFETKVVAGDYATILGRSGTDAEIKAWVGQMDRGMSAEAVTGDFFASPEFLKTHADRAVMVEAVYQDLYQRPATDAEMGAATAQFVAGVTPAGWVEGLINSAPTDRMEIDALYHAALGRPSDPAGVDAALAALTSGKLDLAGVAANLLGSPEAIANAQRRLL